MVGLKSRLGHCTAVSDLDANQIKSYPKARQREQTMNVVLNGLWISDFSFQFSVFRFKFKTLHIEYFNVAAPKRNSKSQQQQSLIAFGLTPSPTRLFSVDSSDTHLSRV